MDSHLDYGAMRFWWDVVQTIVLVGITIYVWVKNRSQVNTKRIDQVEKQLVEIDKRIDKSVEDDELKSIEENLTEMDKRLEKALGHEDLEKLYTKVNSISRDLAHMKGEATQQNKLLHRMDDYLRNQGAKQ